MTERRRRQWPWFMLYFLCTLGGMMLVVFGYIGCMRLVGMGQPYLVIGGGLLGLMWGQTATPVLATYFRTRALGLEWDHGENV